MLSELKRQSFSIRFLALLTATGLILIVAAVVREPSQQDLGNAVVAKVEEFRRIHGHLPDSLEEIRVAPEGLRCPCYCKTGDNDYIVWYGTTLGHSVTYDSQTRKWSDVGQGACKSPISTARGPVTL